MTCTGAGVDYSSIAALIRSFVVSLARTRPHVLVSDISMPDEDGYALLRRVRALGLGGGARLPAVALTAYARAPAEGIWAPDEGAPARDDVVV